MTLNLQPADADETAEAVRDAIAAQRSLDIVGHGSRRRLGRPVEADAVLDLSRLSGVVAYEPNELVITVGAATPIAQVQALLAGERQHLAFEPPDYGPLWGEAPGLGTVGGMLSVGHGGARRPFAGAPRDHLLGFKAVNGEGQAIGAGGRVVKNVTGFDLPKLVCGAFGTLGVLTEVTLKALPAPQAGETLVFTGLDDLQALAVLRQAALGVTPIAGAAHLPAGIAGDRPLTLLRIEGMAAVLPLSIDRLQRSLSDLARPQDRLDGAASAELWRAIGGAAYFTGRTTPVWRVGAPPASATAIGASLQAQGFRVLYDWAGGLIWAEAGADAELGGGKAVRAALAEHAADGHATRIRGDDALKARISPFQPQSPGVAALSRRIKARFDPLGLLNPGRMDAAS